MVNQSYLSWISNQDLFKAIEYVYTQYNKALRAKDLKSFNRNVIDPFTLVFDIKLAEKDIQGWIQEESTRQLQKTLNNAVGEFHQIVLSSCNGWQDLGRGHETSLDIKKQDNTIFAEIKNKFNTMNSGAAKTVLNNLENVLVSNPSATAYLVQIIVRPGTSFDERWIYGRNTNEQIRRISGDKFYEIVTTSPSALKDLYCVLPQAIQDYVKQLQNTQIEIVEGKLIDEITSQLEIEKASEKDLITYFFDMVYPSGKHPKVKQFSLQLQNNIEPIDESLNDDESLED